VASLSILGMLCFVKKFKGNLKYNSHIHGYNSRGKIDLKTQNCNTLLRKSVVNMGVKLRNKLPERIKTLSDFKSFKKEIKFLLLNLFIQLMNFCSCIDLSIGDMSLYLMVICISYILYSITFY
jgi:hypothetical protein